jgi:hypothetical protein
LSRLLVTATGFGLLIGFINHSQVVITINYNTLPDFYTTKHSTLIFSVYLHLSPLSVSWHHRLTLQILHTKKVFNSHDQLFSNYEPSTVVSHLELTRKRGSVSPINPCSDTRETLLLTVRGDARRCEAMHDSSWLCSARLGSARRKHRVAYCCVNVGACFDVIVHAWRKYATISPPFSGSKNKPSKIPA